MKPKLPDTPGMEVAGVIEAVGDGGDECPARHARGRLHEPGVRGVLRVARVHGDPAPRLR